MTEEQTARIIELLEIYNKAEIANTISFICCLLGCVALLIFVIWKEKKIKQYIQEYKATLTKEQLEDLQRYERIAK